MRRLVKNEFGGYWDPKDHSYEVSKSEAKWLVATGKAVIVKKDNR